MEQYLYLTTRGRTTGRSREIEIWFTERHGRYYVIAEYQTSQWVKNVEAEPNVRVKVAGKEFSARARILDPKTDEPLRGEIQALSRKKYGWGEGLVVELTAESPA